MDPAELGAHGLDGGVVGGLLVALAAPAGGGDGRALGDAHQFEGEAAIDDRLLQAVPVLLSFISPPPPD